ncbi:MAG TPA: M17 family peptidase N-terminal domain-containing protein, partial [Solirubrobacterales bacterium]|nr:M17 family peptidase N-terminal domain-containing protein [Solirubrobacterales bacterium]
MKIEVTQIELGEADADLLAVGLVADGELPAELAGAAGAADATGSYKRLSTLFAGAARVLVAGLGMREELDAERLRVAAALVAKEAASLRAGALAWALPEGIEPGVAAEAIVTGTVLGSYRYDRFRAADPEEPTPEIESLTLIGPAEATEAAAAAGVVAAAANRARDLQSTPANFATPSYLAERAEEIAAGNDAVSVEVLGREQIREKKMGGLLAVSQGSAEEPRLIVLRYSGGGSGPTLGFVGKGVTFDTGGIS